MFRKESISEKERKREKREEIVRKRRGEGREESEEREERIVHCTEHHYSGGEMDVRIRAPYVNHKLFSHRLR